MPRTDENPASLMADLRSRLDRLVDAARREGREEALAEVRGLVGGAVAPKRGPGRPPKSGSAAAAARPAKKSKRKNPWASMSPADRLARVNAIRKGRGLPLREKL